MHSEVVDHLRCLNVHAESWLVAAADATEDRHIVRGVLGCPVCHAQYPITDGVADFSGGVHAPLVLEPPAGIAGDPELAMKLAAMLDLTDMTGYVILCGAWARLAHRLRALVPVHVVAVNPPPDVEMGGGVSGILTGNRIPLAASSARGVAIDTGFNPGEPDAAASFVRSAVSATHPAGRVVAPASLELPEEVTPIAADELHRVGSRSAAQPVLKLVRAPR